MSFPVDLLQTFGKSVAEAESAPVGCWINSGSSIAAEIVSSAGFDWVLLDGEHSPYGLETLLRLLQITNGYPVQTVVRIPENNTALIKQYLDLGAQNLMIPMINSVQEATDAVKAMHYPPRGVRGVGSAVARSARWNLYPDYLQIASQTVTLIAQIESTAAVNDIDGILAVDGIDMLFVGPSDLAASMGYLGQQMHPEVKAAVKKVFDAAHNAGKPVGVNVFDHGQAQEYLAQGADFIIVASDVQMLAVNSVKIAAKFKELKG